MPTPKQYADALSATPRNSWKYLADAMQPVSEFADEFKVKQDVPLIGGMSAADFTGLKGAFGLADDASYGKYPIRGASLQTAKVDPRVIDAMGLAGALMPVAKNVGKAALREGARQIETGTGIGRAALDPSMEIVPNNIPKFPKTDGEIRSEIAQRNAAKPISEGGLGLPADNMPMDRAGAMGARQANLNDLEKRSGVMWHGSPSGIMPIGGVHVGTKEAARQALEARIGIPTSGKGWIGDTVYGETPLLGKSEIDSIYPGEYRVTGYNSEAPDNTHFATGNATYSGDVPIPLDVMPANRPYMITGDMTNAPRSPLSDMRANAQMKGQLTKGNAKRGYYYKNEGEDEGSISAVVPSQDHLLPLSPELLKLLPNGNLRSRFAAFDPFRRHEADILAGVGIGGMLDPEFVSEEFRKKERK